MGTTGKISNNTRRILIAVCLLCSIAFKVSLPAVANIKVAVKDQSSLPEKSTEKLSERILPFENEMAYQGTCGTTTPKYAANINHCTAYQNNYVTVNYQVVKLQPPKC